jgi:hypothetical protein
MSQEWKEPAAVEEAQMPLGTGGGGAGVEEEYTPERPRMNTSTMALIGAFLVGLVVLYALALQNKPQSASAADKIKAQETSSNIDKWLKDKEGQRGVSQLGQGLVERIQGVMGTTKGAGEVVANPFMRAEARVSEPTIDLGPSVVMPVVTKPAEYVDPLLKEVAREFQGLKLQMVMMGNPPAAMINNKMAKLGTEFGHLKITEIQADRVLLTYENKAGEKRVFALTTGSAERGGFGSSKP